MGGMRLDEPCCLLMSNCLKSCTMLDSVDMPRSFMGPKGGAIFIAQLQEEKERFTKVDLADNDLGTYAVYPLSLVLENKDCAIHTLYLARNNLEEQGGLYLASALANN